MHIEDARRRVSVDNERPEERPVRGPGRGWGISDGAIERRQGTQLHGPTGSGSVRLLRRALLQ